MTQTPSASMVSLDDKTTASRRNVDLGDLIEGRYVVTTGLKAGEKVIVQGQERVQDGAAVEAVPYAANAPQAKQ